MVRADAGESSKANANASGSNGTGLERFIKVLVEQVQMVAKHFSYTEEYVLSHTTAWLNRKFKQAQKEQFDDHQGKVLGGFQSALLILDALFNKGKEFNKILPPSIEEAMKQSKAKEEINSKFVSGVWWGNQY